MSSLAKQDLSAPCRRCAETLQAWERFCPFCGEDQAAEIAAGDAGSRIERTAEVPDADETFAPMVLDFANTVQPDAEEVIELPEPIDMGTASEAGIVQAGAPPHADGEQARRAAPWLAPRRKAAMAIGMVLALILGQLAYLTLERGYLDNRAGAGGLPAVKADIARLHTALNGADLGAESTVPDRIAAPAPPATPIARIAPVAPVAATAPSQSPVPLEAPTPEAAASDCSETLAALALCPTK
ncbi:MAG: hypothetical protein ABJA77_04325 [Variovorax sp.]